MLGPFIYVYQTHIQQRQTAHRLSAIADGPYKVAPLNASTVIIVNRPNIERVSRVCIAQSPITASGTPVNLDDASQTTTNSNARTSPSKNSALLDFGDALPEYCIDLIIDYVIAHHQSPHYRVQGYECEPENDTSERIIHPPKKHIVCFHHIHDLSLPPAGLLSQTQID